jgi:hypothetical protein
MQWVAKLIGKLLQNFCLCISSTRRGLRKGYILLIIESEDKSIWFLTLAVSSYGFLGYFPKLLKMNANSMNTIALNEVYKNVFSFTKWASTGACLTCLPTGRYDWCMKIPATSFRWVRTNRKEAIIRDETGLKFVLTTCRCWFHLWIVIVYIVN